MTTRAPAVLKTWVLIGSLSQSLGVLFSFRGSAHQAVPCCLAGLSPKGMVWPEEVLTQTGRGQVLWAMMVEEEVSLGLPQCLELLFRN